MTGQTDDAQRQMEQRALRNVRGLVDKIEVGELEQRRAQRRTLAIILMVVAALAAGLGWVMYKDVKGRKPPAVIDPAKLPPIVPGPQR